MRIIVVLVPQPNDCLMGIKIKPDIISTLNEIKNNKENITTYQTCFDDLKKAAPQARIEVLLSDGVIANLENGYTLSDILDLEKVAIEEVLNTQHDSLKTRTPENEIKVNSIDFYQALYYDNNIDELEGNMIKKVKDQREGTKDVIDNELGIISKIVLAHNIKGKAKEIISNGIKLPESDYEAFFVILSKIKLEGFTVPYGCTKFSDTKELSYTITFESGYTISRKGLDFSIIKNKTE